MEGMLGRLALGPPTGSTDFFFEVRFAVAMRCLLIGLAVSFRTGHCRDLIDSPGIAPYQLEGKFEVNCSITHDNRNLQHYLLQSRHPQARPGRNDPNVPVKLHRLLRLRSNRHWQTS